MNETVGAESALQETITAGYIVISILLSSIVACTLIGNLFVIAAILIDKNLQTTANQLVLSLAVADLMVACLVMPLGAYNDINQGWWLGKGVCEFWTSADVLCCTASILNLLAIALDRYWAVTNVDYIYKRTRRRVSLMILCAWTVGAVVSLAPIFGWKDPDFARRVLDEHKCLVSQDVGYQIFATISTFYAPLVLLLALYWRIFQVARKRIRYKPGGRKSGQSVAAGSRQATNLMIESGKSPAARNGGQENSGASERDKQSRSCAGRVVGEATAAGEKSFAQVKVKMAAGRQASARAANVESDCSGYCDEQTAHCYARTSENKARSVGQPGASAPTELTAVNFVAAASATAAAAAQQEFDLTSAPTLTNDKFRLACTGGGGSDESRRSFVAPESRLCQRRTPSERGDESSGERDNGAARGAGLATDEKGGIVGEKGAKMNEREICLRRAGGSGSGSGRQAMTVGCTATARDAACDQRMVQDRFLHTGSGAHTTRSPDAEDDDNKTNELAQAAVLGANARPTTMIELGDKLTSVSRERRGQPRALKASEVEAPTDNDNEIEGDDYTKDDHNQRDASRLSSLALNRVPPRPSSNLCHVHQRSLVLVHEPDNRAAGMNRQDSGGGNNSSLAQLDARLLASMASDSLVRPTFADCQHSAPTSSQVSECQACCCCGGGDDDDDGDRTQSEPEDEHQDEFKSERNHRLRGACALPASWHSDKRLACASRDDLGLLDTRLGVASGPASPPLPAKSSADRIRELLASQGFKEPVPLRASKSSRHRRRGTTSRRRDERSSSNNHWLGSASSPSSSASDFSSSESSASSRSMLAAASTARLEPMQLIGGDEFPGEQPAMRPISGLEAAAVAAMTASAGQANKLSDESRDAHDNLAGKRATGPSPGSPLRSTSERAPLTRALTATTRRAATDNHKIDCHPQQQEAPGIAAHANVRRAKFLRSRPSMVCARVAPVASLTGLTRGDGAGSLVSSSSRATLSIRSRFRALGQLVSFVQTSRQFNSTSSAGSESAPATSSQSGDDDQDQDDDDDRRPTTSPLADDHSQADDPSERANPKAGGNQMLGDERPAPQQQQQAALRTTTTTTDPEGLDRKGKTSGDIDRVNGLAVINSISLPAGGVSLVEVAATITGAPSPHPQSRHKATLNSKPDGGLVSGATHHAAAATTTATTRQPRQSAAQQRRQNMEIKREKKAAKTLAIITGVFVCCWLPFFLNAIVMPICGSACTPSDLILSVLLWLGYLNSLLNPIIYTIFSPDFRRAFHRLLCWPDQARNDRAHKQRAGGGGCRARNSSDTPPVPPATVHHHQQHHGDHQTGARHRVLAAMA